METLWPVLSVVCLLVVVGAIAFVARIRSLSARVGSFSCALRRAARPAIWEQGIAHYCVDRIDWYRPAPISFRPTHSWSRGDMALVAREPIPESDGLRGGELSQLGPRRCEDR